MVAKGSVNDHTPFVAEVLVLMLFHEAALELVAACTTYVWLGPPRKSMVTLPPRFTRIAVARWREFVTGETGVNSTCSVALVRWSRKPPELLVSLPASGSPARTNITRLLQRKSPIRGMVRVR